MSATVTPLTPLESSATTSADVEHAEEEEDEGHPDLETGVLAE